MKSTKGTIVYLGRFELPDRNAAAHRVTGNAKIFRDLGYRVVLLGAARGLPSGGKPIPAVCHADGIEAWHVCYPESGRAWLNYITSGKAFERLCSAAAIDNLTMLICYNHPAVAQSRLFRLVNRMGAIPVADVTEWYSDERLRSFRAVVKNADNYLRMHWSHRQAEGMIVTSQFVADHYSDMGVPTLNLPTIYPARPHRRFALRRASEPPRLFFAGTGYSPAIVAASKTGPKERLDWLVELLAEAHAQGAEFRQVIYGATREDFLEVTPELGQALEQLGDRIDFRGRVPHSELLDDLSSADFAIFFRSATRTTLAGFPSKLAEAVTFGTPVITNPMPNTLQCVDEGQTGFLLDIADRREAASRLKEILALSPERIRNMKQACLASGQFTYERYVEPTRQWLQQMFLADRTRSDTRELCGLVPS